jgi:hypothetical protein
MKNSTAPVICATCLTLAAAIIGYDVWAKNDILAKVTDVDIFTVSVVKLNCSPDHFWGHAVSYKRHADPNERHGYVCRDWRSGVWTPKDL